MERERKWQSRVLCLTRPSDKSIFLALRVTAGWSTGRQRDATAVWKYTDVAGFAVAARFGVRARARVYGTARFSAARTEVNMHAAVWVVCSAMLHEILFWSRFVCTERRSACACASSFHVFRSCALACFCVCACVFVCVSQELEWADWSFSNVNSQRLSVSFAFLPPLCSPLSPLLSSTLNIAILEF